MIDEKGNITTKNDLLKKYYCYIKENTTQIAIVIPSVAAIYAAILDYYFYIVSCGYYKYFWIDDCLMLPYNKVNLYQNIRQLALFGLYWGYAIFAVRMFLLKRNYLWKFVTLIVIPLLCNGMVMYNGKINLALCIASFILLPFQWGMLFSLGYCMVASFHLETSGASKRTYGKNNKKKIKKRWGNKEYRLLGILLIFIACVMIFFGGYSTGRSKAAEKRRFGIVKMDEGQYAVIDANENKLILQKCEINQNNLRIDANTYLCVANEMDIIFNNFENVELNIN